MLIIGILPIIVYKFHIMNFRKATKQYVHAPLSRPVMLDILKQYRSPNDKISELIKSGELLPVRRGLYVPGPEADLSIPEPFLVANHLRGPSYVSLESALSYWGLIPERVFEISSATVKSSKNFVNPLGRFTYHRLPTPYYSFGIKSVEIADQQIAMIASPEKALCDKIVLTAGVFLRSGKQARAFLLEDLRMDEDALKNLDTKRISSWIDDAPKKDSLKILVKTIQSL